MKLAKINHERCREVDATTYVWIPDVMERSELQSLVDQAQVSYLKAEEEFSKLPPGVAKPPGYVPNIQYYKNSPDKTVKEIYNEWERATKDYNAYNEKVKAARKSFADHLVSLAPGKIEHFYEVDPGICVELDWGHQHGKTLVYGNVDPDSKDLNAHKYEDSL